MAVFCCATGLGRRGDLLALRAVRSPFQGIWAPPFPALLAGGDLASGIPHSAAAGALATTGKKAHRAPSGALCFFVPIPSLTKASF